MAAGHSFCFEEKDQGPVMDRFDEHLTKGEP